jgi:tRNA A22 N-methylase
MAKSTATTHRKVTPEDLRTNFQALQDGLKGKVDDQKSTLTTVAGLGGLLLVVIVFLLGRKSGKKKTTLVEIRRV